MRQEITPTVEDYLKAIYTITATHERATTNEIAEHLHITPASVTGMIKRLVDMEPPLVEYQSHRGVVLTAEGENAALKTIRYHRLLELFLNQILGYEWEEVHAEADRLEHVISEEFEERMAATLGEPSHDPHGDPIPSKDLRMPDSSSSPLSEMRPGQEGVVLRVRDENPELLRYLRQLGIILNTDIKIIEYSPLDENLILLVSNEEKPVVLGPRITQEIFVKLSSEVN